MMKTMSGHTLLRIPFPGKIGRGREMRMWRRILLSNSNVKMVRRENAFSIQQFVEPFLHRQLLPSWNWPLAPGKVCQG